MDRPDRIATPLVVAQPGLAALLEAVEVGDLCSYTEAWGRLRPEDDVAVEAVAGGVCAYTGPTSPITQAVGMGMSGPVDVEEIERMEAFFFSRGVAAQVAVCPQADGEFVAELGRRGYRLDEFEDLLIAVPEVQQASGATGPTAPGSSAAVGPQQDPIIREVRPDEAADWARTVARGFTGSDDPGDQDVLLGRVLFERPEVTVYQADLDGRMAAGAALSIQHGVGTLLAAATLPAFRNRGAQTALTHHLLAEAARRGCRLVAAGGAPGSTSHRNQERAGLRVAYTKVMLVREPS